MIRVVADIWAALVVGISSTLGMAAVVSAVISAIVLWYFFRPGVRSAFGR